MYKMHVQSQLANFINLKCKLNLYGFSYFYYTCSK